MKNAIAWMLLALASAGPAAAGTRASMREDSVFIGFDDAMQTWSPPTVEVGIEPALPLACRWDSDTALVCDIPKPARAPSATRFRVAVPALVTQQGSQLPAQRLVVETPRPAISLERYGLTWRDGVPSLFLTANQPMDLAAAEAALRLAVDGRPVPVKLAMSNGRRTSQPMFELVLPALDPEASLLELSIVPGLSGLEGPLRGTQQAVLARVRTGEPARLAAVQCGRRRQPRAEAQAVDVVDCEPGLVTLTFSRELDDDSRRRFADALPRGVELAGWSTTRRTDPSMADAVLVPPGDDVFLRVTAPRSAVRVVVAGLRARGGRAVQPGSLLIRTGDTRPALHAAHASLLLASATGGLGITAVNAPGGLGVEAVSLARDAATSRVPVPTGPPNVPVAMDDGATRRVLAQGGWARWRVEGDRSYGFGVGPEMAAPAFDVATVVTADDVLVWLNDWKTGRGVAGARV
ncbi:MAG TPA: hypothetical protein VLK29_04095, partial [Luteimonas sp.]|nr:hypothetical protein [Luteimonas sp.]